METWDLVTLVLVFAITAKVYAGSVCHFCGTCLRRSRRRVAEQHITPSKLTRTTTPSTDVTSGVGSLHVWTGPMFSGKTTHVHHALARWADLRASASASQGGSGSGALMINHATDSRGSGSISSHSSAFNGLSKAITAITASRLSEVAIDGYDAIGVDEAQWFDDLDTVVEWANKGKHVYVAGLDGDARGQIFGHIHLLVHAAESFLKLPALCMRCIEDRRGQPLIPNQIPQAPFTDKLVKDEKVVDVGGADKYVAVCRAHRR